MSGLALVITSAGIAALANAQSTGVSDVLISQIGLADAPFTAAATLTGLPHEFKRLTTFGGEAVGDATIHISIRDDSADAYELFGFGLFLDDGTLFATYSQEARILGKSSISQALLAADIRLSAAVAGDVTFGAPSFMDPPATTDRAGLVELATSAETLTGTDAQRAVTSVGLKAKTDAVTAEAHTYADSKKAEAIAAATTDATAKANAAQAAAIAAAATDATAKANAAQAAAIGAASTDATNKANTAQANAQGYADTKKAEAIGAAATDATNKANGAQAAAIGAAATDATAKANAAQSSAQGYADTKKTEAITAAATDATNKANAAQAAAIGAAATDASNKANAAQAAAQGYADTKKAEAITAAATDATGKANAAQAAAIGAASTDASTKANAAQAAAQGYADTKKAEAIATAAGDAQGRANTAQANAQGYADTKKAEAIATALSWFTGANQSLASPGYQKFPGGLILQWGEYAQTVASDGMYGPISFPIVFPNTSLIVVPVARNPFSNVNADSLPSIVSHDADGFSVMSNTTTGASSGLGFAWLAVGF